MTAVLYTPHKIYKRYQSFIESVITALGLSLLVGCVLVNIPVYPPNWAPVLVTVIGLLALRWSLSAYLLAAITVVYPVYTISLYLAIIFVVLVVLGHRVFSHYLGATVLILAVPWLAQYHLPWLVPILAGLWWGTANGFWMGMTAALWGKLLAGMSGLEIDWLLLTGQSPVAAGVMQRFHNLDALETLLKILQPFAVNATVLLYHLLQIALWGAVGALMGILATRKWQEWQFPWSVLAVTGLGAGALAGGEIALAFWLAEAAPISPAYDGIAWNVLVCALSAGTLEIIRQFLDLPLTPRPINPVASVSALRRQSSALQPSPVSQSVSVKLPELPEWEPPEEGNDLILLELD